MSAGTLGSTSTTTYVGGGAAARVGNATTDTVGFYGITGVAQATFVGQQSINALSVSGVVGFTSSTSLSSMAEKVNSILTILSNLGLMASA